MSLTKEQRLEAANNSLDSLLRSEDENIVAKAIDMVYKTEGLYKPEEKDTRPVIQIVNFVFPERELIPPVIDLVEDVKTIEIPYGG
jgi:hypothetical protein